MAAADSAAAAAAAAGPATASVSAPAATSTSTMQIIPLGGGQEVGRSCLLLKFKGRQILLDAGCHPGREGYAALPHFDSAALDPAQVDLVLITHFHLDHCASLPYFTEKTAFNGRVFMTHPTKAVMRMLLADYLRLLRVSDKDKSKDGDDGEDEYLYTEADLENCLSKCEQIDFHQTVEHQGIAFTAFNAGHVLGAAMFLIDIDGTRVLYTGDYSTEEDRHLMSAELPPVSPDLLIVESTFGVQVHSNRQDRETRFTSTIESIVRRGGKCLVPVFATGRAQELLLILDEFWQARPDLQDTPVYFASRIASKALRIYQTYVNMMTAHIRRLMDVSNPFRFSHIRNLPKVSTLLDEAGPAVVLAAPGMLQSGTSRQLFERWCDNSKNGVVLAAYSVEGTLAKALINQPREIVCLDGRVKPRRCMIEYVSFAAHVDYIQNSTFIRQVRPDNIILVHGEAFEMSRLKAELDRDIRTSWDLPEGAQRPRVVMPRNQQSVKVSFEKHISAKLVGAVAEQAAQRAAVDGLMVTENFTTTLVARDELEEHTKLCPGALNQRLHIRFTAPPSIIVLLLQQMFDDVQLSFPAVDATAAAAAAAAKDKASSSATTAAEQQQQPLPLWRVRVESVVDVEPELAHGMDPQAHARLAEEIAASAGNAAAELLLRAGKQGRLVVAWEAGPLADTLADAVVGVLLQAEGSPLVMRALSQVFTSAREHAGLPKEAPRVAPRDPRKQARGGGKSRAGASLPSAVRSTSLYQQEEEEEEEEQDEELEDEPLDQATAKSQQHEGVQSDQHQQQQQSQQSQQSQQQQQQKQQQKQISTRQFEAVWQFFGEESKSDHSIEQHAAETLKATAAASVTGCRRGREPSGDETTQGGMRNGTGTRGGGVHAHAYTHGHYHRHERHQDELANMLSSGARKRQRAGDQVLSEGAVLSVASGVAEALKEHATPQDQMRLGRLRDEMQQRAAALGAQRIELDASLSKLVVVGEGNAAGDTQAPSAYVAVRWSAEGRDRHAAIVESEDETLRAHVVDFLRLYGQDMMASVADAEGDVETDESGNVVLTQLHQK